MRYLFALLVIILCCSVHNIYPAPEKITSFYVSLEGKDINPGTLEAPVATLQKAIKLAEARPEPAVIIMRGGTYLLTRSISIPRTQKTSRLVIKAAEGEKVILDGSVPLEEINPLEGYPDVYTAKGNFISKHNEPPPVWDATGKFFLKLSSLETVRETDYSCVILDKDRMALRYQKGHSPLEAGLRTCSCGIGIGILRDNVTIKGLEFHNFISATGIAGVRIGQPNMVSARKLGKQRDGTFAENVIIDSCYAYNCFIGFHVYISGKNATITHCETRNCVTGIWVSGIDTLVEHCTLINDSNWHKDKVQWVSDLRLRGISFYHAPEDAIIRYNFIKNFRTGIFSKGSPGKYIIEHNTVLNGFKAIAPDKGFQIQYNIFSGFDVPFGNDLGGELEALIDNNLYWGDKDLSVRIKDESKGGAPNNIFVDPLFASPDKDDYRLLTGSPAIGIKRGKIAGAFPCVPEDYKGQPNLYLKPAKRSRNLLALNMNTTSISPVTKISYTIDGGAPVEKEFKTKETIELPTRDKEHSVVLRVQDTNGMWSKELSVKISAPTPPLRIEGEPTVTTSIYGALFSFKGNGNMLGRVEYLDGEEWVKAGSCRYAGGRIQPLLVVPPEPKKVYKYRLTAGRDVKEGTFELKGEPRIMYVSREGEDSDMLGSREKPFRTIQYALDRALPGDRVRILPGFYIEEISLKHGGTPENPLIIEGLYPNTVTLDGLREIGTIFVIDNSPNIILRNINFQWYKDSAILIKNSENLHLSSCRFRNHYWLGATGVTCRTLVIVESPKFVVKKSIFCRTRYGIGVYSSSGGTITQNTFLANSVTHILWRGRPEDNINITYNSINWNGNQMINIGQPQKTIRKSKIDYNNYGTTFMYTEGMERAGGKYGASLERPFSYLPRNREFMAGTKLFVNMSDWQKYSGQDSNSIFANPKWVSPIEGRFDVASDSPNLLSDGKIIGALGFLGEKPNMPPEVIITTPYNGQEVKGVFTLEADASDYDGKIAGVEFYVGDKLVGKVDKLPYQLQGVTLSVGNHQIKAKAIDNQGGESISDRVNIVVVK